MAPDTTEVEAEVPEPDDPLPEGPVLYMGMREGDRVTVVPVAEIRGDSLRPLATDRGPEFVDAFVRERLAPGTSMAVWAGGVRVGRMEVEEVGTDSSFCHPRPTASGTVRLLPSAGGAERFLAVEENGSPGGAGRWGEYRTLEDEYPDRAASVELTVDAMREVGARWPRGDLVNYRADLQVVELGTVGPRAFTSTFLVGDVPRVTPADSAAWALFVFGVRSPEDAYRAAFTWYRPVGAQRKGIPLYFQHADWDGDGEPEILLEMLGARERWTAALGRRGTGWDLIFHDPCDPAVERPVDGAGPSP